MDLFDEEFLRIWRTFEAKGLRYMMVGGFAVNLHGHFRTTGDLDIWIEDKIENRRILRACLADLNLGDFEALETMDFIPGWTSISLFSGIELDIMTYLKGYPQEAFNECLALASLAEINGICIPFLHINHLIREKKLVNREKDLADIEALKKIKRLREES
jgi:hypothetical protein